MNRVFVVGGGSWGAALAHRLDQKTLKYVFALFLVAVGLNMLWKVVVG